MLLRDSACVSKYFGINASGSVVLFNSKKLQEGFLGQRLHAFPTSAYNRSERNFPLSHGSDEKNFPVLCSPFGALHFG